LAYSLLKLYYDIYSGEKRHHKMEEKMLRKIILRAFLLCLLLLCACRDDSNKSNSSAAQSGQAVISVPEPSVILLFGSGLAGLIAFRKVLRK
jgi:hypothetical protein